MMQEEVPIHCDFSKTVTKKPQNAIMRPFYAGFCDYKINLFQ